jgi:iron uptake system EfeUOB component EfeO/EfeM
METIEQVEQETQISGEYGSYGDRNLITFQSKVSRGLFDVYDVFRRIQNKTRKEGLEDFMRWSIERYRTNPNKLNEFLEIGKERYDFTELEKN